MIQFITSNGGKSDGNAGKQRISTSSPYNCSSKALFYFKWFNHHATVKKTIDDDISGKKRALMAPYRPLFFL
jgi:hypothetical protein